MHAVGHSLVLVFVPAEAAAAEKAQQQEQQAADQATGSHHTHALVGLWKHSEAGDCGYSTVQRLQIDLDQTSSERKRAT